MNPQSPSSLFLSIPGEIRNQIYSELLLLSPRRPIIISPGPKPIPPWLPQQQEQEQEQEQLEKQNQPPTQSLRSRLLSLFLTCRQIHLEASSLFYSRSSFALPADSSRLPPHAQMNLLLRWFLDRIGEKNASSIRSLGIPTFPFDQCLPRSGVGCRPDHDSGDHHHSWAVSAGGAPWSGPEPGEDNNSGNLGASLLDAVRQRCKRLERVELDLGMNRGGGGATAAVAICERFGLRVSTFGWGQAEYREEEERVGVFLKVAGQRLRELGFEKLEEVTVWIRGRRYTSRSTSSLLPSGRGTRKAGEGWKTEVVIRGGEEEEEEEEEEKEEEKDYENRKKYRLPEDLWTHYHPDSPPRRRRLIRWM